MPSITGQQNQITISKVEGANPAVSAGAYGTVIRLVLTDDNVNAVIDAGLTRVVIERSKDTGLTYQEISTPSERPVLQRDEPVMIFFDRRGDPGYLYRFRYVGTIEGQVVLTEPSEAIEGVGLAIRGVLSVAQLIARYFFGIGLTDDAGRRLPDAVFEHYILNAIRWLEHTLDIPILPTSFVENHDYYRGDYLAFCLLQLDNYPVISVEEFRVAYPSGQSVIVFPNEWLRLDPAKGTLQVVPTAGTLSEVAIGQGGSFLPAIFGGMDYLPQLFEVSYTAGFEVGRVPRDIVDVIGMMAALGPFNIFGDLITGAGIGNLSLSLDGLSQSITTTQSAMYGGYGNRVVQYTKQIKEQITNLRRYYKGVRLIVA